MIPPDQMPEARFPELSDLMEQTDPELKTASSTVRTWYVEVRIGQATEGESEAAALESFKGKFLKEVPTGGFMEREYVKFSVSSDPFID